MNSMLHLLAETEAAKPGIFESLGVDWQLLIIQTVAFLVLLWVLTKFVYPALSSMLDKREATIQEGIKAAEEAEQKADASKAEIDKMLGEARKRASEITASAKNEAASVIEAADAAAAERTERMIAKANSEIEKEVTAARKQLRDETVSLVALATEKVIGTVVTDDVDKKVIASALKDAK